MEDQEAQGMQGMIAINKYAVINQYPSLKSA
jgi:hypothetical protein